MKPARPSPSSRSSSSLLNLLFVELLLIIAAFAPPCASFLLPPCPLSPTPSSTPLLRPLFASNTPLTILIDHSDSYTSSLSTLLSSPPLILPHTTPLQTIIDLDPTAIVLGPGPGSPYNATDAGVSAKILCHPRFASTPILAVCLGHQLLAVHLNMTVLPLPKAVHGVPLPIDGSLWQRYNSWHVPSSQPCPASALPSLITSGYGSLKQATRWSVQYHPESCRSTSGSSFVKSWESECCVPNRIAAFPRVPPLFPPSPPRGERKYTVSHSSFNGVSPLLAAVALREARGAGDIFFLDSSSMNTYKGNDRYSYLGCFGEGSRYLDLSGVDAGYVLEGGEDVVGLFKGGYVGVIDYEAGAGCFDGNEGGDGEKIRRAVDFLTERSELERAEVVERDAGLSAGGEREQKVETMMRRVDEWAVWDHETGECHVCKTSLAEGESVLERVMKEARAGSEATKTGRMRDGVPTFKWRKEEEEYKSDIREVQRLISMGETYEVCLTNEFTFPSPDTSLAWDTFKVLREVNRSPYGCYMSLSGRELVGSSPEVFLECEGGRVRSKPIKGTIRRGATKEEDASLKHELETSVKDLAENSMIVDLVSSDFHRCASNVSVARLHEIETYETVHQLVSTVEGDAAEFSDVVRCCFPGGSMTGAPKRRSMEIIKRLEGRERGAYAGCVGFVSYNGDSKLAMTIRSAVFEDGVGRVGAGGAITGLSIVDEEWKEVELKGDRVKRAVEIAWRGGLDDKVKEEVTRKRKRDRVKSLVGAVFSTVLAK